MISEITYSEPPHALWAREPKTLFERAPEAILVFDDNLVYLDANPAACELLQRSKDEIVGKEVGEFSEQDGARLAQHIRDAHGKTAVEENLTLVLPSGQVRYVELVTRPNLLPGVHASFSRDVTERRQMRDELEHHNRLEAIGKVAGGVAHDFNNMLTAILSYTDLQLQRSSEDGPTRRYALGIQAAAERAAETTRQLLAFCRKQNLNFARVDLNQVAGTAVNLVQRLIGENIELVLELDPNLPEVIADAGQLTQVILNLAINARDAMPGGGRLTIATAQGMPLPHSKEGHEVAPCVSIFVHDTGSGMSSEVLPHIFDPFFTTKPIGKGTGLGLSTVYGIVKQSRGKILVNSEPGHGTTFEIVLPAVSDPAEAQQPALQSAHMETHQHILD